jgi:hypothetical protein
MWQEGDYLTVNQEKELSKGENNDLFLPQVAFGRIKFHIKNQSSFMELDVSVLIENEFYSNQSFKRIIRQGEEESNTIYIPFMSGLSTLKYRFKDTNESFKDTIIDEVVIPHNEDTDIYFTYPPQ